MGERGVRRMEIGREGGGGLKMAEWCVVGKGNAIIFMVIGSCVCVFKR